MSKATRATPSTPAHAPAADSQQGCSVPTSQRSSIPAAPMSTQDLIARIWDTLDWSKSLQVTFIIAVSGITAILVLAGLERRSGSRQAASW